LRIIISATLATLFVFLAGFNVWIMLSNRGKTPRGSRLWTQVHRAAGYTFIGLFMIFSYFMLMRLRGQSNEISPRIALHMAMALSLAPLLIAKVIAARYQKTQRGLLMGLGISIFAVAFTLVAGNLAIHYLRLASTDKVPASTSETVIAIVMLTSVAAFFAGARRPEAKSATVQLPVDKTSSSEPQSRPDELTLTLARIENQTHDAKTLRFLLPPNQQIAPRPGQFLTFDWIIDGKTVKRSYTICSSATQRGYVEITPKRVENGYVSKFLNDHAKVGLTVKAHGPYGKFHFDETKHDKIVLIAGGSGITPMIAMLRYIDDLSIKAEVTLIYCVRAERDVFFKDELALLQTRLNNFRYVLVLSQPHAGWEGFKGRLQKETLERTVKNPLHSTFFLCGPPPFMDLGRSLLEDMGVDPSRVLQESFGSGVVGEKHSAGTPDGAGPLQITLLRSAQTCNVSSSQTLLESLEQNGVLIPSGCRQGICGTCATKLLNGNVRMDNEEALTEELRAKRFILPCVARPVTNITLDA